uniref:Transcription initiation factor TFIID subunit 12 n=1 Tax=Lygus hesperus TaxID=30085 RepID=A0A0A9Z129_LYGHE
MENHNPPVNMDGDMNKYVTVPQQVQVGQPLQVQEMQTVQPQVQHIQQVQVPQIQQTQSLPQVQQVQVQNSDGVTTTTQQVTIVNNSVPNTQSLGTLHDALTNRLNHNLSTVNARVSVPTPSLVSVQTPTIQQQHQSKTQEPQPTQILTRARMQDLVREVDPNEQLDEDVEEILLQMADDFVESAITAACLLAKHRKSSTVEVKDLQLHLERNWNMWIPGFGTDELRPYKRSSVNDAHKQRLTLIRKTLKKY